MKSISSPKKSKKKIYILTGLIILLLAVASGVFLYNNYQSNQENDRQKNTSGKADEIKKQSKETINKNVAGKNSDGLPEDSTSKTTDQVPTNPSLSVNITSTSQTDGLVKASAQTSSEGTCVFQYTTDGDKPAISQVTTNNKTCESSIPQVQFSKLGQWNLKVVFYSNGQKAEIQTNVTIN